MIEYTEEIIEGVDTWTRKIWRGEAIGEDGLLLHRDDWPHHAAMPTWLPGTSLVPAPHAGNTQRIIRRAEPDVVPWGDLDPGIRDVVRALRDAGFPTIASCQGHGEGDAWVVIEGALDEEVIADRLGDLLIDRGWAVGCVIESVRQVLGGISWTRVRWWGAVPFR